MVYMSTVKNKNRLRTIDAVMPHLQKILVSADWLISSVFFFNTRAIN